MPITMDDIDRFFHFLGYGDIKRARVWFLGSEPGGEPHLFNRDQQEIVIGGKRLMYDQNLPQAGRTRAWTCARDVASHAAAGEIDYFLGNMAPLPKKSEKIRHSEISERDYLTRVRGEYVPRLFGAIQHFKPSVVVFHGKGAFHRYCISEAFGLSGDGIGENGSAIRVWEGSHVIACNSFTRGSSFPNSNKDIVARKIREWLA